MILLASLPRRLSAAAALASLLAAPATARANGFEFPSNGSESFARGSAWLARASDPLAVYNNPAALSRNGNGVSLSANLIWQKTCLSRRYGGDDPVNNGVIVGAGAQLYYQSCNDGNMFPNPQVAFQLRLTDKLGVGFAALGPSAYGKTKFPVTTSNTSLNRSTYGQPVQGPAGSRYLVTNVDNIVAWPQIGVGYEVAPKIRVGASFIWGIADISFGNVAMGLDSQQDVAQGKLSEAAALDVDAQVKARDWFVPGFVLSGLATLGDSIDVAAWFHWSDKIKATGKADITTFVYDSRTLQPAANKSKQSTKDDGVRAEVPQPWEARIGGRYYKRRAVDPSEPNASRGGNDPLRDEVFDVELDLEYSHDSQFKELGVFFDDPRPQIHTDVGDVPVPANSSVPHNWKDSFGVRLGGDFALLPGRFALRAGAWYQTAFVDAADMHIDFVGAQRLGLTGGGTVRVGPVDIQLGYGHIFFGTLDNHGNGNISAIAGNGSLRSKFAVNGGQLKAKADIISVGAVARW